MATTMKIDGIDTNVKVSGELYSAFVRPDKFTSDVIIPPKQQFTNFATNISSTKNGQESYSVPLQQDLVYSSKFVRQTDVKVNLTGVLTYQDYTAVASSVIGTVWDGTKSIDIPGFGATPQAGGAPAQIDPCIGGYSEATDHNNSNPYQAPCMSFVTDFLNCYTSASVSLSHNGNQVCTNVPDNKYIDVMRRRLGDDQLEAYDGLRYPDRAITYGNFAIPFTELGVIDSIPDTVSGINSLKYSLGHKQVGFKYSIPTFEELEADRNVMTNTSHRGGIWRNKKVTYLFTKQKASPNYTFNTTTGTFTVDPNDASSTTLYTMKIGQYQFPTNVSNWEVALPFVGPNILQWFCDKLEYMPSVAAAAVNNLPAHSILFKVNEPLTQMMNIEFTIEQVSAPVYHQLLSDKDIGSISNTTIFRLDILPNARPYTLLSCPYTDQDQLIGPQSVPRPDSNPGSKSTIGVQMTFDKSRLIMKQYNLGNILLPYRSLTTTLPYWAIQQQASAPYSELLFNVNQKTINKDFSLGIPIDIAQTGIPKYLIMYIDRPASKINSINVTINNGNNVIGQKTFDDTLIKTKENGMLQYGYEETFGYPQTLKKSPFATYNYGAGTLICLEYGTDISLENETFVTGLIGTQLLVNFSANVTLDRLSEDTTTAFTLKEAVYLRVFQFSEGKLFLTAGESSLSNGVFTSDQIKSVFEKFTGDVSSILMSTGRFLRGGAVHSLAKIKHLAPKFNRGMETAKDIYAIAKDVNTEVRPAVETVYKNNESAIHRILKRN